MEPRTARRLLTVLGAAAVIAACAPPGAPELATLRAYLSAEPATLNFITENDGNTMQLAGLVADTLVDFGRDLAPVPRLATAWEISPDSRTVTFHLHPGVRWHDGQPLTSDDVAFSLEKVLDPASLAAGKRSVFETVETWETPDPLTFRATRREPDARLVTSWETLPILPRHVFAGRDFVSAPEHRAPIGTGPWRFQSWEAGRRIVLEANPEYFGGPPDIARLEFRPLPEAATRLSAFLAGELDLTSLRPLDRERLSATGEQGRILVQDVLFVWYIAWNQDGSNPFFGDSRVRRAMTMALDRAGFVERVLGGTGRVATSFVHPAMAAFDPDLVPWAYDPEAAARLLDAAGWRDLDGDGVREHGGRRFAFTLILPAGNQEMDRLAVLFQEGLRGIGVEMALRTLEYNVYRGQRDDRQFEAMAGGWNLDPDPDCYDFWHSSQRGRDGINYPGFANAEVDRLCEAGRRSVDPAERITLYRRVQRILHEEQPATFIAYRASIVGLSRRLQGVEPHVLGIWNWYPGPLRWRLESPAGSG